jgi:hypothetical protein
MIEPFIQTNKLLCIKCNAKMRFSCKEIEKSGFVHDVFECPKCRSTQSYVTQERAPPLGGDRVTADRGSGADTLSEAERQMVGERRSQIVRRSDQNRRAIQQPSPDQLGLFAKRVKRAMRDDKSRHFFCVAAGESDFRGHADVLRVLEWIEELARD